MHCGLATETLWSPRGMNEGGEDGVLDAGLERFAMQIELYFYSTMKIRPLSFKIVSILFGAEAEAGILQHNNFILIPSLT